MSFKAASADRLFGDRESHRPPTNAAIRSSLKKMQAHSFDLWMNNENAKGFHKRLRSNVVGKAGIRLQSQAKKQNGKTDNNANKKIEAAWKQWSKEGNCTMCGCLNLREVQELVLDSVVRDGEAIVRMIRADNEFGFALEVVEVIHLDVEKNEGSRSGRQIVMGVERDAWKRPLAYHILEEVPEVSEQFFTQSRRHRRLDASNVLHIFVREFAGQARGIPWLHAAMNRTHMLGEYLNAELIAARYAASRPGFYKSQDGLAVGAGGPDSIDQMPDMVEPGQIETLPSGWEVQMQSARESKGFEAFEMSANRSIAASVNQSYVSWGNDLRSVSYSSIRQGVLGERDEYAMIQCFIAEKFLQKVFERFVFFASQTGRIRLPERMMPTILEPNWLGRGWPWVDPQKEINAKITELDKGLTTRTRILGQQGLDFEETTVTLAAERDFINEVSGGEPEPTTLNGAQITSAIEIIAKVSSGEITPESGTAALVAFLNLSEEAAKKMVGTGPTPEQIEAKKQEAAKAFGGEEDEEDE